MVETVGASVHLQYQRKRCQRMPLELHVWGPGFGLPSIDAECLATIAYLRNCEGAEWELVQSSDPSICPSSESHGPQTTGWTVLDS